MKLSITRDTLLTVRQCILRGGPIGNPALGAVALVADKVLKQGSRDKLTLRASIGLIAIEIMLACDVAEEGEIAVDAKALRDTVATMPDGKITLELKKSKLTVTAGKRRWTGNTRAASEVGVIPPAPADARSLILPARELLTMVDRLRFAVDYVPTTEHMRLGIFLDIREGRPTAVVIGNHVQAFYTPEPAPEFRMAEDSFGLLLTPLVIDRLREVADEEASPEVEIKYSLNPEGGVQFAWLLSASSLVCFTPPREAFMDWRSIFGKMVHAPVCRLPRLALLQSLGALLAAADSDAVMRVTLDLVEKELVLEHQPKAKPTDEPSTAYFEDRIPVTGIVISEMPRFQVSAQYFRQALDAAGEDVVLHFDHGGSFIVLTTDRGFKAHIYLMNV